MINYIVYYTKEVYNNEDESVVEDFSLRAYSDVDDAKFAEKLAEIAPEEIIFYQGKLYPENVPEKYKALEELQDGFGDKMIYENFVESIKRQYDTRVSNVA